MAGLRCVIPFLFLCSVNAAFAQPSAGTAQVRHAPTLNGTVEGSLQQMLPESTTLNGGAGVSGDLLVPGTPTVRLNGNPTYGGTLQGLGATTPTSYKITLNGGASLGHVIRRTDAVTLPTVAAPPLPAGTRSVTLNSATQSPGDFSTLKNLTLNGSAGAISVPPGTYGDFTANGTDRFTLGVAGGTTPAVYHFQHLTLNGTSRLDLVGPVNITLANGVAANGSLGHAAHPDWLALKFASGGLTLNGNVSVYGYVSAPAGPVTINGNAQLVGGLVADQLTLNGSGLLRLLAPPAANLPPTVTLTAPANGATFPGPASFTFAATATDADGSVARVEFYQGATKLGDDPTSPYTWPHSVSTPGSYTYTARAIDNLGATADSAAVTISVTSPNQPPVVTLTSPADGTLLTAPAAITLAATATDPDGSIGKVEFYQGPTKLGEDFTAPYEYTSASLAPGTYVFSARAYDQQSLSAVSTTATVTVVAPNLSPTVSLTAPANGATFNAPAAFLLSATAADPDGVVAKVEFFQGPVIIGEDAFAPFEFAVSGLAAGSYNFLARATDNTGSATDSAPVALTVVSPNVPPTVTLTAPVSGANFTLPLTLTLAATATDSDGTIAKVEFFNGPAKLGETLVPSTPPATFTLTLPLTLPGTYALSARATDNLGASTTSAPQTVTVTDRRVPFLANFEPAEGYQPGPLHGQNGWSVTGPASIVASPVYAGQQAVSVAPATPPALLVRSFVNADPNVTFVDFFARPAAAATANAGVFVDTDAARVALTGAGGAPGRLQAFQGDGAGAGGWFPTGQGPALDATGRAVDWLRLTVRADYTGKKWDLYFNGRMIAADLGFIHNTQTAFTGLGLSGHPTLTTGFDDLLVAFDNPLFVDADHDGMADAWESAHGLNPALNDRNGDLDSDGLTNIQEYLLGTNPNATDSDSDGLTDAQERALGTNPTLADSDGDGLPDGWEQAHNLNPLSGTDAALDGDGDGISNLAEFTAGTDPTDFFNASAPQITPQVGPDGQLGPDGVVAVRLTKPDGTPWANAPVYFITGSDTLENFTTAPMKVVAGIQALLTGASVIRTDAQGEARIAIDSLLTIPWPLTIYPVGANAGAPISLTVWPHGRDGNGNQLADAWEQLYFPAGSANAGDDPDADSLTNAQEERAGTNPLLEDTDGDGLKDGWELAHGTNPLAGEAPAALDADGDTDGLTLREEAAAGTDPTRPDSDGDGLPDGYEVRAGINPLADDRGLDPDGDGLTNEQERMRGTDPTDYYNGVPHVILPFIGGEGDLGAFNLLAVRVVALDGTPLVNAPVTFDVDPGEQISLTPDGPLLGGTADVRTGPGGIARIYLHGSSPTP